MLNYLKDIEVKIDTSSPAYKAGFAAGREMERIAREEIESRILRIPPIDTEIAEIVCGYYGLTMTDIRLKTRKREICYPRQVLTSMLCKYTKLSFKTIGRFLGGQDHTTIIHSNKTIKDLIQVDAFIRRDVLAISNRIEEFLNILNEANPPL